MTKSVSALLFAAMVATTTTCLAQFDSGTVLGTIKDASGAVVVGSKVTLTNVKTGIVSTAQSGSSGSYSQREFNQTDTPVLPLPLGNDSSNGNVNIANKQFAGAVTYTTSPSSLIEVRMGVTKSIDGKWPIQIGLPTDPELAGSLSTQSISGYAGRTAIAAGSAPRRARPATTSTTSPTSCSAPAAAIPSPTPSLRSTASA